MITDLMSAIVLAGVIAIATAEYPAEIETKEVITVERLWK